MTVRFVLDESSWATASDAGPELLSNAVEGLVERLDVARERDEGVVKHIDFYEADLGNGVQLYSVLFEPNCPLQFEHDLANQLQLALDRANAFEDRGLVQYDAEFAGSVRSAPGVAWAHACCLEKHQVAVLPLALPEVPHGHVLVGVAGIEVDVFFVTEEPEHVEFFRSAIVQENADERAFARLALSAFPTLDWADGVWDGLGDFSGPYIAVRDELVRYLGGLSDYGAACFRDYDDGDRSELPKILSARIGATTSDENGHTKRHKPSRDDRTRSHRGTNKVFWWHVKLRPHVDRIYFLYELPSVDHQSGLVVVGIFKDHCILPN